MFVVVLTSLLQLKMRGKRARLNENGDGEVDEAFWAQAAADQAANREHDADLDRMLLRLYLLKGFQLTVVVNANPAPFATQFFQDDDFGPGFDDEGGFDGESRSMMFDEEQDLLAATQSLTRRVRPEFVNYARKAKRVDVRKLKENIWKGLGIVVPKDEREETEEMVSSSSFSLLNDGLV